jgi:hypothetical protein
LLLNLVLILVPHQLGDLHLRLQNQVLKVDCALLQIGDLLLPLGVLAQVGFLDLVGTGVLFLLLLVQFGFV